MTIYWTSEDCHGQAILTLHLSVGQVILFPYFDHCTQYTRVFRARVTVMTLSTGHSGPVVALR